MKVEPIHAHSFFTISLGGAFSQILTFDYLDREHYYYKILENEEAYRGELGNLLASMNKILEEEEIRVNGESVKAEALTVNLDFRGAAELPTLVFYIEFSGKLRKGINSYECWYEEGVAEYDYEIYWFFPKRFKIIEVDFSGEYEVLAGRLLVIWVRRGERYRGYERIVFKLMD